MKNECAHGVGPHRQAMPRVQEQCPSSPLNLLHLSLYYSIRLGTLGLAYGVLNLMFQKKLIEITLEFRAPICVAPATPL